MAASALLVAPGLLFFLAFARPSERFEFWLLKGFTLALFGVPAVAAAVQAVTVTQMTGPAFILLILLLCIPSIGFLAQRAMPSFMHNRSRDVIGMILLPLAILLLMTPKFYWEALNDDGAHSLLSATLFITQGLPFWPPGAGDIGGYPTTKMMTEVFLQTGFVRLLGAHESTLRFAYLPGISILFGVMLSFLRDRNKQTDTQTILGLGAALLLFSFVMAFNPSYNPYFADIALPMSREPLIFLGVLGYILFFMEKKFTWMAVVSSLALLSSPNGILLIGFFLIAHFILVRPLPVREVIIGGLVVLVVVSLASALEMVLKMSGLIETSGEFNTSSILHRLRYVTIFDTQRFLFWLLPCGILPGLALLAWPWQDRLSRILTLMTVAYVLFFYVQAYRILPHHFAPAALMPLIVFWRLRPVQSAQSFALIAALAGLAISTWISWPETLRPFMLTRDLGHRIAIETESDPFFDLDEIRITQDLIAHAFPPIWTETELQDRQMVGSTSVYVHARMPVPEGVVKDYFIRDEAHPLKAGEVVIGDAIDGRVLVVRDKEIHEKDLRRRGTQRSIADAYHVPFDTIFGRGVRSGDRPVWDIARLVGLK